MPIQERKVIEINEYSTGEYEAVLTDEQGELILLNQVTSITIHLIELATGNVVNGRDQQDALNDNDVTFGVSDGTLTWTIQKEDTEIVNEETKVWEYESHLATITVLWQSGERAAHREILLKCFNLHSVS